MKIATACSDLFTVKIHIKIMTSGVPSHITHVMNYVTL